LYGLHQAPRVWYAKLDETLQSLGFIRCPSEPAIYTRSSVSQLIIGVYVDGQVITRTSLGDIKAFKTEMARIFNMSDLGPLHYYLGIEVKQGADGIYLSQGADVRKILEKNGLTDCNPYQFPMEPRLKQSKQSSEKIVDKTTYRSVVGSLRYLVNTHPDIGFDVGYVSRFLEEPHEDHLAAVKHILHYLAGTCDWGLYFGRKERQGDTLTGYSDSDYAGDVDVRYSTTRVIFFHDGNPITWQSMK
jgi:hypothetical protein